jgi:hypothetical protein
MFNLDCSVRLLETIVDFMDFSELLDFFGLSGILGTIKRDVSETGSVFFLRRMQGKTTYSCASLRKS